MKTNKPVPEHFTSHEVAKLIHVSPSSVLQWIDRGMIPAFRTPGGHRRVQRSALIRFLREHEMPIPKELGASRTLLVVDDDAAFRRNLARAMKRKGAEIQLQFAEDATEGLLLIGTQLPDAVLLDAHMPGIDGVTLLEQLRGNPSTAHVTVIGTSGRPSRKLERQFAEAGAMGWLAKPFGPDDLLALLDGAPYGAPG